MINQHLFLKRAHARSPAAAIGDLLLSSGGKPSVRIDVFKVPSPEEAKLDDRFRLGVWIGKTSRGDDHLIFDGDEASSESTRLMLILSDRGLHESVFLVIVRSDTLHGTPNCKACAVDGPSHS